MRSVMAAAAGAAACISICEPGGWMCGGRRVKGSGQGVPLGGSNRKMCTAGEKKKAPSERVGVGAHMRCRNPSAPTDGAATDGDGSPLLSESIDRSFDRPGSISLGQPVVDTITHPTVVCRSVGFSIDRSC